MSAARTTLHEMIISFFTWPRMIDYFTFLVRRTISFAFNVPERNNGASRLRAAARLVELARRRIYRRERPCHEDGPDRQRRRQPATMMTAK